MSVLCAGSLQFLKTRVRAGKWTPSYGLPQGTCYISFQNLPALLLTPASPAFPVLCLERPNEQGLNPQEEQDLNPQARNGGETLSRKCLTSPKLESPSRADNALCLWLAWLWAASVIHCALSALALIRMRCLSHFCDNTVDKS